VARKPRIEYPGALYHVIARGNNRDAIFYSKDNYVYYLGKVRSAKEKYSFCLFSFCLMPNHIHLLIQTQGAPLSRIMISIQTAYARYFNKRYKRVGHVFQNRYKAILCDADSYLLELIRYIHLNPVRAGIVDLPQNYPWSSHRDYTEDLNRGLVDKDLILPMFSKRKAKATRLFSKFALEKLGEDKREDLYEVKDQRFLGDEEFIENLSQKFDDLRRKKFNLKRRAIVDLKNILTSVAKISGVSETDILSKDQSRETAFARHIFMYVAKEEFDFKGKQIAEFTGRDNSCISHAIKNIKGKTMYDEELNLKLNDIVKRLTL